MVVESNENTHKIVIDKMINLWLNEPETTIDLFKKIAYLIAEYDTPQKGVYFDSFNKTYFAKIDGKTIKTNKNFRIVNNALICVKSQKTGI